MDNDYLNNLQHRHSLDSVTTTTTTNDNFKNESFETEKKHVQEVT